MIDILDLLHVTPRLWDAAFLFHPRESPAATKFVRERTLRILRGEAVAVIRGLRRMGTEHGLRGNKHAALQKICGYLEKNRHRMRYDEYLAAGYPIASGVIEGACRYLVKDRMEITGARWGLDDAEAVLKLRALRSSGDLEEYWRFHKAEERKRHHLSRGNFYPRLEAVN